MKETFCCVERQGLGWLSGRDDATHDDRCQNLRAVLITNPPLPRPLHASSHHPVLDGYRAGAKSIGFRVSRS